MSEKASESNKKKRMKEGVICDRVVKKKNHEIKLPKKSNSIERSFSPVYSLDSHTLRIYVV